MSNCLRKQLNPRGGGRAALFPGRRRQSAGNFVERLPEGFNITFASASFAVIANHGDADEAKNSYPIVCRSYRLLVVGLLARASLRPIYRRSLAKIQNRCCTHQSDLLAREPLSPERSWQRGRAWADASPLDGSAGMGFSRTGATIPSRSMPQPRDEHSSRNLVLAARPAALPADRQSGCLRAGGLSCGAWECVEMAGWSGVDE